MNAQTVRETLGKQLQLLSERSQGCRDEATLAAMSAEMVAISRLLLEHPRPEKIEVSINGTSVAKAIHDTLSKHEG